MAKLTANDKMVDYKKLDLIEKDNKNHKDLRKKRMRSYRNIYQN